MFILMSRSAKALLSYWAEIIVAIVLLQYSLKWFLFFWFIQTIYAATARYEGNRCLIRAYQISNECKILAIMKKVNATGEDAGKEFEIMKSSLTEKQIKELEKDFAVAAWRS